MIEGYSPVVQTLLGTLLTWGLTALGAALVFFISATKRKVLDSSLGFAAGVMIAASYWSLLAPAIEMAENSGVYGSKGEYAFLPAVVGFILGAVFIYGADILMPTLGCDSSTFSFAVHSNHNGRNHESFARTTNNAPQTDVSILGFNDFDTNSDTRRRFRQQRERNQYRNGINGVSNGQTMSSVDNENEKKTSWSRILLLIVAITIHNIPEGLAVGVGFGAIGKTESATFENARNLALGIGIQNFPEGLAVSLPLKGAGFSSWNSFWYGQLSGMVEPLAGLLGALLVTLAEPILPYALAFAAGAMIYVVVDDIIPEANSCGNGRLASWGSIVGFSVMMSLDVALG